MTSSDYRTIAREKLQGNWGNAILVAFIAALLGGLLINGGIDLTLELDSELEPEIFYELPVFFQRYLIFAGSFASILSLIHFILGGVVRQGYCQYLLKQHDDIPGEVSDLFSQFHRFGDGFCLALLEGLYIVLWSLLFIIPGIVASYRYAMAPFVLLENPDMTASEAIATSKKMMDGHKGELFILDLSFFGWDLLNVLTLGIGTFWLNPYKNAARTAFFRSFRRMD